MLDLEFVGDYRQPQLTARQRALGHDGRSAGEFSFGDFLDIINPLQHIPIISSFYREITGDEISPHARVIGDTLFAMGCGRLFEGTAEQMHDNLQRLAQLPDETRVYCAHEYTLSNGRFALTVEPDNAALRERMMRVEADRAVDIPTVPTTIGEERATNPFMRAGSGCRSPGCSMPDGIAASSRRSRRSAATISRYSRKRVTSSAREGWAAIGGGAISNRPSWSSAQPRGSPAMLSPDRAPSPNRLNAIVLAPVVIASLRQIRAHDSARR